MTRALTHLEAGEIYETDGALASLETLCAEIDEDEDIEASLMAATVRSWRGLLQRIQMDYRKAARHFAMAARLAPREDYELRWAYVEQQVRALVNQDQHFDDRAALDEASKTCTGMIVVLHDDRSKSCRFHAKALLGELLVAVGEREQSADRFKTAAEHLRESIEYFDTTRDELASITSNFTLANALSGLGRNTGDLAVLEDAVRIYQQLSTETQDGEPALQRSNINTHLGIALSKLGAVSKNVDILDVAIETLRSCQPGETTGDSPKAETLLQGRINAALASALAQFATLTGKEGSQAEAAPLYKLAVASMRDLDTNAEIEHLEQEAAAITKPDDSAPKPATRQPKRKPQVMAAPIAPPAHSEGEETQGGYLSRLRASLKLPNGEEEGAAQAKPSKRFFA